MKSLRGRVSVLSCRLYVYGLGTGQSSMFSCWRSRQVGKAGSTLDCKRQEKKALDLDFPLAYLLPWCAAELYIDRR